MELTDLEICKRIAEIEGIKVKYDDNQFYGSNYFRCDVHHDLAPVVYRPLTDDALCFQLIIKYDLDVIAPYRKNNETTWEAQIFSKDYFDAFQIYDKSLNRAICLAIIEANK